MLSDMTLFHVLLEMPSYMTLFHMLLTDALRHECVGCQPVQAALVVGATRSRPNVLIMTSSRSFFIDWELLPVEYYSDVSQGEYCYLELLPTARKKPSAFGFYFSIVARNVLQYLSRILLNEPRRSPTTVSGFVNGCGE